jgi:hypothetical protein
MSFLEGREVLNLISQEYLQLSSPALLFLILLLLIMKCGPDMTGQLSWLAMIYFGFADSKMTSCYEIAVQALFDCDTAFSPAWLLQCISSSRSTT